MARLNLHDSTIETVIKMSGGNPGALTVLLQLLKEGGAIDPDAAYPVMLILWLDTWQIYDENIWILYKDVCGESIINFIAMIRYRQLGMLEREEAFFDKGRDFEKLIETIQVKLPKFNRGE